MGGMDAARAIRASGAAFGQVPIIALTANALDWDDAAFRAAGMDGFLTKPVDMDRLLDTVDHWTAPRKP